jgi:hypothetical protein
MELIQTIFIIVSIIVINYYLHRDYKKFIKSEKARTDKLDEKCINSLKEIKK